ncbi:MAG: hypothetical protein QFB86_02135 [Patescibacteria group bacterium]|nr:hypothetical protein [Patescibacteria group bacterium]
MKIKSLAIGLTTVALTAVAPAATVFAGYAPSTRATFTCNTPTDCPGANYVTFNSFTNAPNYGDERAFFDVKDAANTASGGYADSMTVKDGQKITMRVYVHNNANPNAIGEANATAKNTKVQVQLPTSKKTSNTTAADISADNAIPGEISDTADLNGAQPFTVVFDKTAPVTVTYRPNGTGEFVTRTLPGAAFASDSTLNASLGDMKGCFNYASIITVTAIVHMDATPVPPVTPPVVTPPAVTKAKPTVAAPTTLPNTGAGDVAAIAAGAGLAGSFGYRRFLSRRLAK